jgi:L-ascorbate metabolism protein UlaG (beta-lactamase superfamily)
MHIIWHGQSFFQILAARAKAEQVSIAIDPFDESTGLKPPSFSADILLITHDHSDHNNKKIIKGEPLTIEGPGEYESKEIYIMGIPSWHDEKEGKEKGANAIYVIDAEEMRICHLGDFGQKELTTEQIEKIGDVDILMVPVGGNFTLDAKGAAKVIAQIEPRIVIPMHYHLPNMKIKLDGVDQFLKEMGKKTVESQPKLLIKKKDLPAEETNIVVLKP